MHPTIWSPVSLAFKLKKTPALKNWLIDSGSFTRRLSNFTGAEVEIQVIQRYYGWLSYEEQIYLNLRRKQLALIREVYLYSKKKTWQYARTIMPIQHLKSQFWKLKKWKNIPLGYFLFSNPAIRRSPFEIAELKKNNFYYERASALHGFDRLWARRSLFSIRENSILITEVFSPELEHEQG